MKPTTWSFFSADPLMLMKTSRSRSRYLNFAYRDLKPTEPNKEQIPSTIINQTTNLRPKVNHGLWKVIAWLTEFLKANARYIKCNPCKTASFIAEILLLVNTGAFSLPLLNMLGSVTAGITAGESLTNCQFTVWLMCFRFLRRPSSVVYHSYRCRRPFRHPSRCWSW